MTSKKIIESSFRDPSGFLFCQDGTLYRQINACYKEQYDYFMNSGLYQALIDDEALVPHCEIASSDMGDKNAYRIIKPDPADFISYPYEWSFSQLKAAALATINIQKKALRFKMSLKDASAYNIQFINGKPKLIDTLSFEKVKEGEPWVAYRQFCQHFIAPLALMSYKDVRLGQLLRIYIDGIPLDLASALLPLKTWINFSLFLHIHLHAKSQQHFAGKPQKEKEHRLSAAAFHGLFDSLESCIKKMRWRKPATQWGAYYSDTNYSEGATKNKKEIVLKFLDIIKPNNVWDLGANNGFFSRISSHQGIPTIAFDVDPVAVEKNYNDVFRNKETSLLPLVLDLMNPSAAIGWENLERSSFIERGPAGMAFALALIHHLAIANNLPFDKIAAFFSKICKSLIIEFVPKNDSQVQRLLSSREDIFLHYDQETFEAEFIKYFQIQDKIPIKESARIMYLMTRK